MDTIRIDNHNNCKTIKEIDSANLNLSSQQKNPKQATKQNKTLIQMV